MESIAILGGTFNPFHNGHLKMALETHKQFNIKKIIIMPSYIPSYKNNNDLASADDRCAMITQTISKYSFLEISLLEIERRGNTYTSDTLKYIYNKSPDIQVNFIIGADSLLALETWHEAEYVLSNCNFIVAERDNNKLEDLKLKAQYYKNKYGTNISFLKNINEPYSSTSIRNAVKNNISIKEMVPEPVFKYIYENGLYNIDNF